MNKITNSIAKIKTKVAEKKATVKEVLNDKGLSHTAEIAIYVLGSILIGVAVYTVVKKFVPDLFTDIFAKFTEMLGSWTVPTT